MVRDLSSNTTCGGDGLPQEVADLHKAVYQIIFPVLIAIGIATNLLDLLVLSRPAMRGVSYRYLTRLALFDLLYLLFNIPFCIPASIDTIFRGDGYACYNPPFYYKFLSIPLVNVFLTMSILVVVWMSYDRCLAVCRPQEFTAKQRHRDVQVRVVSTAAVTVAVYIPSCWSTDAGDEQWYKIYEWCREVYSRFLPAVLIAAFNITIILTMQKISRVRHGLKQPQNGHQQNQFTEYINKPEIRIDRAAEARLQRERRLVVLLLAVTIVFFITTLPSAIYKTVYNALGSCSQLEYCVIRGIADVLEVSGHVFHFVLYFYLSPEYRKCLYSLFTVATPQTLGDSLALSLH